MTSFFFYLLQDGALPTAGWDTAYRVSMVFARNPITKGSFPFSQAYISVLGDNVCMDLIKRVQIILFLKIMQYN
jgi:hypothetical protein